MSLFKIFDVAGSAMSAQSIRLNTIASNMANANTVNGDITKVYRAKQPVFATVLEGFDPNRASAGVEVTGIVESNRPLEKRYEPQNPLADKDGYVFQSNVNVVEEMTSMISASRSFQNNVEAMNTAKQMMLATLRLGE